MNKIKAFFKRKNVIFSAQRYFIDAMSAMAQGLFASLLIGTIITTVGNLAGLDFLVEIGTFAKGVAGPAMAGAIAYALGAPPLVLFSLLAVGAAANTLGGSGGPLAVFFIAYFFRMILDTAFPVVVTEIIPREQIGAYTSIRMLVFTGAQAVAALLITPIVELVGYVGLLIFASAMQFICAIVYFVVARKRRKEAALKTNIN